MTTETEIPRDALLVELKSITDALPVNTLFKKSQPLQVELGSGDGSFLIQFASLNPQINFLGVERLLGRLRKIDRKGRRARLENVRGLRIEAAYFLEYLLPVASVDELHIYFPDPWPKRKHRHNRLVNDRFPLLARRVLKPSGIVHLRTDDADYFSQMELVFESCDFFKKLPTPESLSSVITDFERGFLARGVQTNRLSARLS